MPSDGDRLKKAKALVAEAQALQSTLTHKPEPITRDALVLLVINGIPLFNSLLKRLNSTTSSVSQLVKNTKDTPVAINHAAKVTPFVGMALNIIDFIQIPLLYLTAVALGGKAPISLSNNLRWLYAAVLLSLCLVSFFIPVAAPFIGIGSACLGFLVGVYSLGQMLHEYNQDKVSLKNIKETINTGPAGQLQQQVLNLQNACMEPNANMKLIDQLMIDIQHLKHDCRRQKKELKALYENEYLLETKLQLEVDVMDHCIGIALSSLAVAGAVVSLFFPPAGLIILLSAAIAGTTYVAYNLLAPHLTPDRLEPRPLGSGTLKREPVGKKSTHHTLLKKLSSWKSNTPSKSKPEISQPMPETEKKLASGATKQHPMDEHEHEHEPNHSSTQSRGKGT